MIRNFILILAIPLLFSGCRASHKKNPLSHPHENLLTLLADCRHYLSEDIYRFGHPVDSSGQNAYKSYAIRLANYETLYPDRYPEILAFMRARLFERLGDYKQAARLYSLCSAYKGELAGEAEKRRENALNFDQICGREIRGNDVDSYIASCEEKIALIAGLIEDCAGSDLQTLARIEKEKIDVDLAIFFQNNRRFITGGVNRAIQKWEEIIEEHKESAKLQSHRIQLADLYFVLAKEYASWKPPERIGFVWDDFEGFILEAQRRYYQVSLEDGYPEKREARAKLEAAISFMEDVRRRSR